MMFDRFLYYIDKIIIITFTVIAHKWTMEAISTSILANIDSVYKMSQIMWKELGKYKKIKCLMGGFHILLVWLKVLP